MLSAAEIRGTQHRRRSPYSDKQHYQEYILQRIEGFKNSIGRDELLRLGDEAAAELQTASEGQFLLTEVLMLESVDRLIMKRLALRPYSKWKRQFLKLREAQRTPTHWGLEAACPVARLIPRLEPNDATLVLGGAAESCAYLLAAHDAAVTFIAGDMGCGGAGRGPDGGRGTRQHVRRFRGPARSGTPRLPLLRHWPRPRGARSGGPGRISTPPLDPRSFATCSGGAPRAPSTCFFPPANRSHPKPCSVSMRNGPSRKIPSDGAGRARARVREGFLLTKPACPADTM